jgi:hypothetical protein
MLDSWVFVVCFAKNNNTGVQCCKLASGTIVSPEFESAPVFENSKYRPSSPYLHPRILRELIVCTKLSVKFI